MQLIKWHHKMEANVICSVIKLQLILVTVAMVAIELIFPFAIKSVLFGSLIALLNSGFLYWRMQKANYSSDITAQRSLHMAYRSAIERFVLTAGLLAVGMVGVLTLMPIVVLISFTVGQMVFLLGVVMLRTPEIKIK